MAATTSSFLLSGSTLTNTEPNCTILQITLSVTLTLTEAVDEWLTCCPGGSAHKLDRHSHCPRPIWYLLQGIFSLPESMFAHSSESACFTCAQRHAQQALKVVHTKPRIHLLIRNGQQTTLHQQFIWFSLVCLQLALHHHMTYNIMYSKQIIRYIIYFNMYGINYNRRQS